MKNNSFFTGMFAALALVSLAITPSAQQADLHAYLVNLEQHGFSGAALVAQDGAVVLQQGYGLANDDSGIKNSAETVFLFGSVTKQFTAAAILKLDSQGALNVNDPITAYLTRVPDDKADITLHQLLTHSSGLPNHVFDSDFEEVSRDDALQRILASDLLFAPGSQAQYSDDAFKLLAAIIEIVSGQSWQDYLTAELFVPAGMANTGFFNDPRWQTRPVATGYRNGQDHGQPSGWPGPTWALIGGGGVLSTVGDMHQWVLALQNGSVIPAEALQKMWQPYAPIGGRASYGYAWTVIETDDGGKFVEITGASNSHNAYMHINLVENLAVFVASNRIDEPWLSGLGLADPQETFYASEVGDALAGNVVDDDFSYLPDFAADRSRPLRLTTLGYAALFVGGALVLGGVWWVVRRKN